MGHVAYLGLGANLGEPKTAIAKAIEMLGEEGTKVLARARLYESAPLGPPGQPTYFNTAVCIETDDAPEALLARLKTIERTLGREPTVRWGPRIIDLDLLLYDDLTLETATLVVPHAEMTRRRFVLAPLADLAPNLVVPKTNRTVAELLDALDDDPKGVWLLP